MSIEIESAEYVFFLFVHHSLFIAIILITFCFCFRKICGWCKLNDIVFQCYSTDPAVPEGIEPGEDITDTTGMVLGRLFVDIWFRQR